MGEGSAFAATIIPHPFFVAESAAIALSRKGRGHIERRRAQAAPRDTRVVVLVFAFAIISAFDALMKNGGGR